MELWEALVGSALLIVLADMVVRVIGEKKARIRKSRKIIAWISSGSLILAMVLAIAGFAVRTWA